MAALLCAAHVASMTTSEELQKHPHGEGGLFIETTQSPKEIDDFTRPPATDAYIGEGGTLIFRTADGRQVDWLPDADYLQVTDHIRPRATALKNGNVRLAWASTADTLLRYEHGAELHMLATGKDRNKFLENELAMGTNPENIFLVGLGDGTHRLTHVRLSTLMGNGLTSTPDSPCSAVVFVTDQNGRVVSDEDALRVLGEVKRNINGEIYDIHVLEFNRDGEPLDDTAVDLHVFAGGAAAQSEVDREAKLASQRS